jgi:hypothetical protein
MASAKRFETSDAKFLGMRLIICRASSSVSLQTLAKAGAK